MKDEPTGRAALTTVFEDGRAAFRRLRKGRLDVVTGPDEGRSWVLDQPRVGAGTSIINDLVLNDAEVAGNHFEIQARDDGFRLRDLDSEGGLFVGSTRVREVYLHQDLCFRAGQSELVFRWLDEVVDIPLSKSDRYDEVTGTSPTMRQIFARLERIAPSDLTCLITGETGTGKERIARAIHNTSRRRAGPMVVLDCGSLPSQLIESALFGHERGSFTGAVEQHRGYFEQADGGTIFLDEIGELDTALQPKLLRVLEERQVMRIGSARTVDVDVRVIAATHRDLRAMVASGAFREDLYYRLSVVRLDVPALRQRVEDISILAELFLRDAATKRGMHLTFDQDALQALTTHSWPGNIRELRNVVQRAATLSEGPTITRAALEYGDARSARRVSEARPAPEARSAPEVRPAPDPHSDLRELGDAPTQPFKEAKQEVIERFEAQYLGALIAAHDGNISGAARASGLTRYHLRELLKRHSLV